MNIMGSKTSKIIILVTTSWMIKLLLIPAYYSTDFAVHQNWLRITHQKSISQWYFDSQSKWTLDYPPLFAYFEYFLSVIANWLDPQIVNTINQNPNTLYFQRISVIVTDLLYLWSLIKFSNQQINLKTILLYLWIPFIILDNIHFQYNLMMQALLIASVSFMNTQRYLFSAFCFSLLLNFKHIYLYCAPAYFVYLLKEYVFQKNKSSFAEAFYRLAKVGAVTIIPFVISFGPFLIAGGFQGIAQIFSRLFPFSRGLIHEYWAPNFWALYYFLDKILFAIGLRTHSIYVVQGSGHDISLVNNLKVLPEVAPSTTIIIILSFLAPIIITYFISKKNVSFSKLVCMCGFIFFMFGFHVHEKAIVPYINLLFLFASDTVCISAAVYVNIVNLIPLMIQPEQKTLCLCLTLIWIAIWNYLGQQKKILMVKAQQKFIKKINFSNAKQMGMLFVQYFIQLSGLILVIFYLFLHPLIKKPSLAFLPFMLNSVWAAAFNIAWVGYLYEKFIQQYGIKSLKSNSQM